MKGGKGNVFGMVAGILVMQMISNGMQLVGWGSYTQDTVKGIILILAIAFDALKNRPKATIRVHKETKEAAALGMDVSFGAEDSFESKFLGQALAQDEAKTYTTCWETYKDQLPAKFALKAWIQVGDADARVPYTQSENFASRLSEAIGEENIEFSVISGADHEDDLFYAPENLQKVFAFIEEALE